MIMKLLRVAFFIAFILNTKPILAACHAVTPSGSGTKNGSNWSNAYAGIPANLTRGDVYYLADGSYPNYVFTTPNSGSTVSEIRKAQTHDYGRITDGCSNDISSGWNAGTMGSSQATIDG